MYTVLQLREGGTDKGSGWYCPPTNHGFLLIHRDQTLTTQTGRTWIGRGYQTGFVEEIGRVTRPTRFS